jgi:hypothetical protein
MWFVKMLLSDGKIAQDFVNMLLPFRHSGFNVNQNSNRADLGLTLKPTPSYTLATFDIT